MSRSAESREVRDRSLFDRIAASYAAKDRHPACRIARRRRVNATLDVVTLPRQARLLDVGCGSGFAAEYLRGRFRSYKGIDYSVNLIEFARKWHTIEDVSFEVANGRDFDDDEPYDAIFMVGVLHHVDDKDALLSNLIRLLRPGGWLVVNEPQPHNPVIRLARGLRSRVDPAYSSEQEQLSREVLGALLRKHGLEDVRLRPQGFFSTPFAEVRLGPKWVTPLCSRGAVWADRWIERLPVDRLAWNCIAAGRVPEGEPSSVPGE